MADYFKHSNQKEGDGERMMSDATVHRLIEYLQTVGWSADQIVDLLNYITDK